MVSVTLIAVRLERHQLKTTIKLRLRTLADASGGGWYHNFLALQEPAFGILLMRHQEGLTPYFF
jgi:hypothetical protein